MKLHYSCFLTALLGAYPLPAQALDEFNPGPLLTYDARHSSNPYSFNWWARSDHYYFVLQSETLLDWTYFPFAIIGDDAVEGFDFNTQSKRIFLRLLYTDDTNAEPYITDFDQDGISNGDELVAGWPLDAFQAEVIVDSDLDGLPDYWEHFHFGHLDRNGIGDFDGDGILDAFEWQVRTDPTENQAEDHHADAIGLVRYAYDSLGRVIAVTGPVTLDYSFDDEGNLQSAK